MAAGLLWILDVGNNTAMELIAFIADTLDEEQQPGISSSKFFLQVLVFSVYIHWNFSVNNCWLHRRITQLMPLSSSGQSCPSHLFGGV
jgi:hypothetical protein